MTANAAQRILRRYAEEVYYRPAIDRMEAAGADVWVRRLLMLQGSEEDASAYFEATLQGRRRAAAADLEAFSKITGKDFTGLAFEWVRLDSPNAIVLRNRSSGGAAIGVDLTVMGQMNAVALAGLDAMRREDGDVVLETAAGLTGALRGGPIDVRLEERMLGLLRRTSDVQDLFAWMGISAFRFVLGHELGHLALGHFDSGQSLSLTLVAGEGESDVSCFGRPELEHEADAWAFEHLQLLAKEEGTVMAAVLAHTVPSIYFGCAELMAAFGPPATVPGTMSVRTHPEPWARAERLRPAASMVAILSQVPAFTMLLELPDFLHSHTEQFRGRQ